MEITYRGRAEALVSFYNSIYAANMATRIKVGQLSEWPSGVEIFDPTGMKSDAVALNTIITGSGSVTSTVVAVKKDPSGTITYNGTKFTSLGTPSVSTLLGASNPNHDFLLYAKFIIRSAASANTVFRQIGLTDSSGNVFVYQNIPAQTLIPGSSSGLTLATMLAF